MDPEEGSPPPTTSTGKVQAGRRNSSTGEARTQGTLVDPTSSSNVEGQGPPSALSQPPQTQTLDLTETQIQRVVSVLDMHALKLKDPWYFHPYTLIRIRERTAIWIVAGFGLFINLFGIALALLGALKGPEDRRYYYVMIIIFQTFGILGAVFLFLAPGNKRNGQCFGGTWIMITTNLLIQELFVGIMSLVFLHNHMDDDNGKKGKAHDGWILMTLASTSLVFSLLYLIFYWFVIAFTCYNRDFGFKSDDISAMEFELSPSEIYNKAQIPQLDSKFRPIKNLESEVNRKKSKISLSIKKAETLVGDSESPQALGSKNWTVSSSMAHR